MSALTKFITWKKGNTVVSWVLFGLLVQVIFNRKNVPAHIEVLDDTLTHHCSRTKRNRWVSVINFMVTPRFVRRLVESQLNKNMVEHERVILSLDKELTKDDFLTRTSPTGKSGAIGMATIFRNH